MIALDGKALLKVANEALQKEAWATTNMTITQVEQKGSTLVFYGTGFTSSDNAIDGEMVRNLDKLAQSLAADYRLAE